MHRDHERYRSFSRRAIILFGGNVLLMSGLVGRMSYLQIIEAERYKTLADENRISLKLLAPIRGRILDRFGRPMVTNKRNYRAILVPANITNSNLLLTGLSQVLGLKESEINRIKRELRRAKRFSTIIIKENLTWRQVAGLEVNAAEVPGVMIDIGESRFYPDGEISAQVVGYVSAVSEIEKGANPLLRLPGFRVGKAGIEKVHDLALRGKGGTSQVEVNAYGREIRELNRVDGKPGNEVWLTIDSKLQKFSVGRLGDESGSIVVMDVHSGEILSLVSAPSFDPNLFNRGLSRREWEEIVSNPRFPLSNKAISGQYAPGSVFKMVVALAALERGAASSKTRVDCNGKFELGDKTFHCWRKKGHGTMRLANAITQSCDIYFYELALKTGIDNIASMARRLGLGDLLNIGLPGEKKGLIPSKTWKKKYKGSSWHVGETVQAGIGQGFVLTTPLQLAVMMSRLVNGGRAVLPSITRHLVPYSKKPKKIIPPKSFKSLAINEAHLNLINIAMADVSNSPRGTAYKARIKKRGYSMGGKTGTVQVRRISELEREKGVLKNQELEWHERDHAIFIGYAPLHAPRYAVSVVVEHGGSGGSTAAPIARDILLELRDQYSAQSLNDGRAVNVANRAHPKRLGSNTKGV